MGNNDKKPNEIRKEQITNRLNDLFTKTGMKQNALCSVTSLSTSTLNNWLTKGRSIPSEWLIPICEFFDCSVDYLLGRTEDSSCGNCDYSEEEIRLIEDYRKLSEQGKGYITETMIMAKDRFKKEQSVHQSVEQVG